MNIHARFRALDVSKAVQASIPDAQTVHVTGTDFCFIVLENDSYMYKASAALAYAGYLNVRVRKSNFTPVIFITVHLTRE